MSAIPQGSKSFQRRNPHLFRACPPDRDDMFWREDEEARTAKPAPAKRIRQSSKPVLNKLESEWFAHLCAEAPQGVVIRGQALTFKLANGLRYSPDFFAFEWPALGELERPTAWETKGKWVDGDSFPKLKMFATTYPEIRVILAWKNKVGIWQTQRILP